MDTSRLADRAREFSSAFNLLYPILNELHCKYESQTGLKWSISWRSPYKNPKKGRGAKFITLQYEQRPDAFTIITREEIGTHASYEVKTEKVRNVDKGIEAMLAFAEECRTAEPKTEAAA